MCCTRTKILYAASPREWVRSSPYSENTYTLNSQKIKVRPTTHSHLCAVRTERHGARSEARPQEPDMLNKIRIKSLSNIKLLFVFKNKSTVHIRRRWTRHAVIRVITRTKKIHSIFFFKIRRGWFRGLSAFISAERFLNTTAVVSRAIGTMLSKYEVNSASNGSVNSISRVLNLV